MDELGGMLNELWRSRLIIQRQGDHHAFAGDWAELSDSV
jgi:hypothetical protein